MLLTVAPNNVLNMYSKVIVMVTDTSHPVLLKQVLDDVWSSSTQATPLQDWGIPSNHVNESRWSRPESGLHSLEAKLQDAKLNQQQASLSD